MSEDGAVKPLLRFAKMALGENLLEVIAGQRAYATPAPQFAKSLRADQRFRNLCDRKRWRRTWGVASGEWGGQREGTPIFPRRFCAVCRHPDPGGGRVGGESRSGERGATEKVINWSQGGWQRGFPSSIGKAGAGRWR